jgi:ribosomal protein S19E (S16A)
VGTPSSYFLIFSSLPTLLAPPIWLYSWKLVTNASISRRIAPIMHSAVSELSRLSGAKSPKSSRPSRIAASTSIVGCQKVSSCIFDHLSP